MCNSCVFSTLLKKRCFTTEFYCFFTIGQSTKEKTKQTQHSLPLQKLANIDVETWRYRQLWWNKLCYLAVRAHVAEQRDQAEFVNSGRTRLVGGNVHPFAVHRDPVSVVSPSNMSLCTLHVCGGRWCGAACIYGGSCRVQRKEPPHTHLVHVPTRPSQFIHTVMRTDGTDIAHV